MLYYRVVGKGKPVVFIAGLLGSTRYWGNTFDSFAAKHRLIFIDPVGFGKSPRPDIEYTLDDHLAAIRKVLIKENATKNVSFVGHSFGGLLAAWYAHRHPKEVEKVMLLGTPAFESADEVKRKLYEGSYLTGLFTFHSWLGVIGCGAHNLFPKASTWLAKKVLPDLPAHVAEDALLHNWRSYGGSVRHVLAKAFLFVPLKKLGSKAIIVYGKRDRFSTVARMKSLAKRYGNGLFITNDTHQTYVSNLAVRTRIRREL